MRPDRTIEACLAGHRRLLAALEAATDDDLREPSLLPRYSRGHVVAHLRNKTDAHVVLLAGPAAGQVRRLHPEGFDADQAADAAARRTAAVLRAELEGSFARIEAAWDRLDADAWNTLGIMSAGPRTLAETVGHHLRNVEVHHVDLDIGYRAADWPSEFVEAELSKRLADLPSRAAHPDLLAWLLGRAPAPALEPW